MIRKQLYITEDQQNIITQLKGQRTEAEVIRNIIDKGVQAMISERTSNCIVVEKLKECEK